MRTKRGQGSSWTFASPFFEWPWQWPRWSVPPSSLSRPAKSHTPDSKSSSSCAILVKPPASAPQSQISHSNPLFTANFLQGPLCQSPLLPGRKISLHPLARSPIISVTKSPPRMTRESYAPLSLPSQRQDLRPSFSASKQAPSHQLRPPPLIFPFFNKFSIASNRLPFSLAELAKYISSLLPFILLFSQRDSALE